MKLGIIVPYRDRKAHFRQFVPHVSQYFARDKLDKEIDYRVLFVEQTAQKPFNRGLLKNIGFLLLEKETDYICFHDIDYLPIWADYSAVNRPTAIVWYGAERRPIAPGKSDRVLQHSLEHFYGGAVLIDNKSFRSVDGYANDYWGWGYEDLDLKSRFDQRGVTWDRRKGTYMALDHDNEGFRPGGGSTAISQVNRKQYVARYHEKTAPPGPGLDQVRYSILSRGPIEPPPPDRRALWEIATVSLKSKPGPEQAKALRV